MPDPERRRKQSARTDRSRGARRLSILVYANVDRAEAGGVQAVVRHLRDHLAARGHAVSTGWATSSDGIADAGADGWVEQYPVLAGRRWLHLRTLARIAARLRRTRPDVVNIHFASPSTRYFTLLAPVFGYRVLLTCHGSDLLRPHPQDAPQLASVLRGPAAVTTVSDDMRERIHAACGSEAMHIAVIENGIDTAFWSPAAEAAAPPRPLEPATTLVAVGRLAPVKGFDILVEALAVARVKSSAAARLVLIGEGPEREALEARAERLGIGHAVEFAGRLGPAALRERLRAADLFVMPSRSEGMPLALLEAMAAGTPALASRVGGVPRVAGDCAVLVEPENPDALANALVSLLADRPLRERLARKARIRAQDFSVARAHHAYEQEMLALVGARPRAVPAMAGAAPHRPA